MFTILVVDDDPQVRSLFRSALEAEDYRVVEADDGAEAPAIAVQEKVDLVFLDMIMPEVEGVQTLRALKEVRPDLKIVAMSGGGRMGPETYLPLARQLGAVETLAKPFPMSRPIEVARRLLAA